MKLRHYLLLVLSILTATGAFAQHTRTGSFVANMPAVYPISGDVTFAEVGTTLTVTFEANFATVQGLTLEVFLAKGAMLDTSTDIKISTTPLGFGTSTLSPITGMHVFAVPPGISLYDFDNILIQCTAIDELWGHANLCDTQLTLANSAEPSGAYRGSNEIVSTSLINTSSIVSYETQNCIELNSGFEVPLTADFTALVGPAYGCVIE